MSSLESHNKKLIRKTFFLQIFFFVFFYFKLQLQQQRKTLFELLFPRRIYDAIFMMFAT